MKNLLPAIVLFVTAAGCVRSALHTEFHPPVLSPGQIAARKDLSWASYAWTGDDGPYKAIKASIDTKMTGGQFADDLRQQMGVAAQTNPADPKAQFAWAYSSWLASRSPSLSQERGFQVLWGVPEAMACVPDPHAYNFSRLRFLLEGGKFLVPLGRRLLQANPHDLEVKSHLVSIYGGLLVTQSSLPNVTGDLKATAILYCQDLIQANPANPRYRSQLGFVYCSCWRRSHDEQDKQRAIAAYRDYLKLAPPNETYRSDVEYILGLLSAPAKA